MPVPNTFANATTSIPLSQLDANFATAITLGNTAIQLGNTVSTLNNMTLANVTISSGTVSVANATVTGNVTMSGGNLSFTSTGQRITGDMSNATIANRLIVQTTTTNGGTTFSAIPNGTSQVGSFVAFNNSDPTNGSTVQMVVTSSESRFSAGAAGTGTYLPMTFHSNNAERMRLDTSGNVGIGTSSPANYGKLAVAGADDVSLFALSSTTGVLRSRAYNTATTGPVIEGTNAAQSAYANLFLNGLNLLLGTGNVERARIDSSGNVGIGTSSPAGKLDILTGTYRGYFDDAGGSSFRLNGVNAANSAYGPMGLNGSIVLFQTGATERMRIDSSGNVGIGTSSPATRLALDGVAPKIALNNSGNYNGEIGLGVLTGFGDTVGINARQAAGIVAFGTNNTERMRIDSSGNLLVGTTSYNYSFTGNAVQIGNFSAGNTVVLSKNTTAATNMIVFNNGNGQVGYINTDGSSTTYSTSSDYRLKHDVQPMLSGLSTIALLKPSTYKWNVDNSYGEGFIAHELQAVIPQAVSGEKDAVNDDGSIKPQGVDYSKIVVHLVAACQEQQKLIVDLQDRLAKAGL